MIYGYARVSSKGQEKDGYGLDAQIQALKEAGAVDIRSEAFTGTTMERPQWDALRAALRPGDTLVVTKFDRIARTSAGGFEAVKELLNDGVKVHILNMGLIDDTPTGRLIMNIMFAFAEFERDMIVERLADGRAQAKASNPDYKEGRPRIQTDSELLGLLMAEEEAGNMSGEQCASELGVSLRTYRRRKSEYKKERTAA